MMEINKVAHAIDTTKDKTKDLINFIKSSSSICEKDKNAILSKLCFINVKLGAIQYYIKSDGDNLIDIHA